MVSYSPQDRRAWIDHYHTHGQNVSATCREFGISRPTLYRWLERYDPEHPKKQLKRHSSRSRNRRKPTWSVHHLAVLSGLMMEKPTWGRGKVRVALAARGFMVSPATVGRMMQAVRRRCPICRVRGGGHDQMSHLLRLDIASMGTDLPLEKPPSPPRRKRSKAAEQAVETAEGVVKRKLPDLGEFNSLLGPE